MPFFRIFLSLSFVFLIVAGCSGGEDRDISPSPRTTLEDVGELGLEIFEFATDPPGGIPAETPIEIDYAADSLAVNVFVPSGRQGLFVELGFDPAILALRGMNRGGYLPEEAPCLLLHVREGQLALSASASGRNSSESIFGFTLSKGRDTVLRKLDSAENPGAGDPPIDVMALVGSSGVLVRFTEANEADYNGDGIVNGLDLFPLSAHFNEHSNFNGQSAEYPTNDCIDNNRDGVLNGLDLFPIATNYRDRNQGFRVYRSLDRDEGFTEITPSPVPHFDGHMQPPCFPTWEFLDEDPSGGPYWYRVTSMRDDDWTAESELSEPATPNARFGLELITGEPQVGGQLVVAARVEGVYDLYSANFSLQFDAAELDLFMIEDHYLGDVSAFVDPVFLGNEDPPGTLDANVTEKNPNSGLIGGGRLLFIGFEPLVEGTVTISLYDNPGNPFYLQDSLEMEIPASFGEPLDVTVLPAE
jgi:hypothetical protein